MSKKLKGINDHKAVFCWNDPEEGKPMRNEKVLCYSEEFPNNYFVASWTGLRWLHSNGHKLPASVVQSWCYIKAPDGTEQAINLFMAAGVPCALGLSFLLI